jgi:hypothetical protein
VAATGAPTELPDLAKQIRSEYERVVGELRQLADGRRPRSPDGPPA